MLLVLFIGFVWKGEKMNGMEAVKLESPLLTLRQAAKFLGLSDRAVWALANRGELVRVQIGRSVRYDIADLKAFIEQQKTTRRAK